MDKRADSVSPAGGTYQPAYPTLVATGLVTLWIAVLTLPMWKGQFLASPHSDQLVAGYAFRSWLAEHWKSDGTFPLWNPELFSGLPFVGALHGDMFYPTTFLRLFLPTATAMNLGFAVHYVIAGLLVYQLLRLLRVSWAGSLAGGLAYELSGVIASLVQPGHDGKLFVSALLPLMLIGLVLALRRDRWEGFALVALAVGLSLFGHPQMSYYALIVAGVFALYLTLGEPEGRAVGGNRYAGLVLALGAVLVGFGIGMIQEVPFFRYLPYSPRAQGYNLAGMDRFTASTQYAIPWAHIPEFFLANFIGSRETYWGTNPLKYHSEYLGLPVVALAVLGVGAPRRKLIMWLAGIGGLFLLVSMGSATPFYRLWWAIMPFVKQTRAPGMAFFVVALGVAMLAAFGVERLERREAERHVVSWLAVGGLVFLLGVAGGFGGLARSLAPPEHAAQALAAAEGMRWGAAISGLALAGIGVVTLGFQRGFLQFSVLAFLLSLIVSADLWRNAAGFWSYTRDHVRLYHTSDPVLERVKQTSAPYRLLDLGLPLQGDGVYPGSSLMAHDVPQALGHHGNEIRFYDELLGGRNVWQNIGNLRLWDLLAVRYVLTPAQSGRLDSIPGFHRVISNAVNAAGNPTNLFERTAPQPYARVVAAAVKASDEQAIATVLDPRFSLERAVLLAQDAPVEPKPVTQLPDPLSSRATFQTWAPGHMVIELSPPPAVEAYLLVSENYYPDWHAVADGRSAPVVRGNLSLITVVLPAGAKTVELTFTSADYRLGRSITFASLVLVLAGLVVPSLVRRGRGG